ncbi:MAG: NfeD family protein [Chitinophagales bacterium]
MDELSISILGALLLLGLLLILIEFFLIPGTTVVGIIGSLIMIAAVVLAFYSQGTRIGLLFLVVAFIASGISVYSGFKVYTSNKLSVNSAIDSKSYLQEETIKPGTEGVTVTDLRPNGKARFDKEKLQVYSLGEYIKAGTAVEVDSVYDHKIFVKSKTS